MVKNSITITAASCVEITSWFGEQDGDGKDERDHEQNKYTEYGLKNKNYMVKLTPPNKLEAEEVVELLGWPSPRPREWELFEEVGTKREELLGPQRY